MSRDDDQPSVPLPAGVAQREQLAALYRGSFSSVECPDCTGTGTYSRPAGFRGGRPQQFVCMSCRGTGRVS